MEDRSVCFGRQESPKLFEKGTKVLKKSTDFELITHEEPHYFAFSEVLLWPTLE